MSDIVKRLKGVSEESLIMQVVRDCMEAAEEIEELRAECTRKTKALNEIRKALKAEEEAAQAWKERQQPSKGTKPKKKD